MIALVNDNAQGIWSTRVGQQLTVDGPGANPQHVIVHRPGERKPFGFPASWLDLPAPTLTPRPIRVGGFTSGWPTREGECA